MNILVPKIQEVLAKYSIKYDPETPVPWDDDLADATHTDYFTPIEPRFSTEVVHAAAELNRKKANDVVKKLLDKYEKNLANPPLGRKYEECWDTHRKAPQKEYLALYDRVKKEIEEMGGFLFQTPLPGDNNRGRNDSDRKEDTFHV